MTTCVHGACQAMQIAAFHPEPLTELPPVDTSVWFMPYRLHMEQKYPEVAAEAEKMIEELRLHYGIEELRQ